MLALASTSILAIGGTVAYRVIRSEASPAPTDAAVVSRAPTDVAPADAPPRLLDAPAIDATTAAIVATDAAVVSSNGRRDAGVATKPARDPALRVAAGSGSPAVETGVGYLLVWGEDNIGAQVFIDGKPAGFAPNKLEVSIGTHFVEIARKGSSRLPGQKIEITAFHSLGKPARATW